MTHDPTRPQWFTFRPEHPEWGENFTNMPDQVAIPDGAGGWDYKSRTKIESGDPWLPIPTAELLQEHFGAIPPPSKETDPEFKQDRH